VVGEPTHATVPDGLEPLVQSVLAEAVRNAHKHARPSRVEVRARSDAGAFVLEVENDGVREEPAGTVAGMGLRLAAFDALEHGGFVEFGPRPDHAWQVKLVVPESTA
jgi:signal transduction histidine kinase